MPKSKEIQEFNGKRYYRYPNAVDVSDRKYFRSGGKYIHRDIWEYYNGKIPNRYQIHHIDHNPANNNIENLELVKIGEHVKKFHKPTKKRLEQLRKHVKTIRSKASEWHKSDEGRKWHSQMATNVWKNKDYQTFNCEFCGNEYQTRTNNNNSKFCSNNCRSAYRRKSGIDDEVRVCLYCNSDFKSNKYSLRKYCSNQCATNSRYGK